MSFKDEDEPNVGSSDGPSEQAMEGPPPDYVYPYHKLILWLRVIRAEVVLTLVLGILAGICTWGVYSKWLTTGSLIIILAVAVVVVVHMWLCAYLLIWDWKTRPYVVLASNANLILQQKLPRRDWRALFVPSSSNDPIDLSKSDFFSPDQNLLQQWFFNFDTLIVKNAYTTESRMQSWKLLNILKGEAGKRVQAGDDLVMHYVTHADEINEIVAYVRGSEQRTSELAASQVEMQMEGNELLRQILEGVTARPEWLAEAINMYQSQRDFPQKGGEPSTFRTIDISGSPATPNDPLGPA